MAEVPPFVSLIGYTRLEISKMLGGNPRVIEVADVLLPVIRQENRSSGLHLVVLDGDWVDTQNLSNGGFVSRGHYGETKAALIRPFRIL